MRLNSNRIEQKRHRTYQMQIIYKKNFFHFFTQHFTMIEHIKTYNFAKGEILQPLYIKKKKN